MLELLLALAIDPGVQEASASPLAVVNTAFMVSNVRAPFTGHIRVVVQNRGTVPDVLESVSTPLGEALEFRTDGNLFSQAEPVALPITLPPPAGAEASYLPLVVNVQGLETGDYWSSGTQVTLRFARAGEITLTLRQSSPAPSPSR
ncbi:hypothetical protein GVN24_33810 [Rhizobium sp. CRIBSB]|nr:hypothetical protein [Rhizobium sp. CRIBSB]